jgi:hypothetical protein
MPQIHSARPPSALRACFLLALIALALSAACDARSRGARGADSAASAERAFAGVQARGEVAMGVDQYTSAHVFEDLPDGGRVVLDRAAGGDTAGVGTIRAHMRDIAARFGRGDFSLPGFVHAAEVPGTAVMTAKRDAITYTPADRPLGGELRIRSTDPEAVAAVHAFLAFQRQDHRAAGHEAHDAPEAPARP